MRRESGASLVFIIILVLGLVALFAGVRMMSRWTEAGDAANVTSAHLQLAATALEQYAAASGRLPCPADPTLDTGTEPTPPNAYSCAVDAGTLPWATIGMRRDDAFDGWGWKISYRVYTGAAGSLVQPGGVSMVNCDTNEPAPAGATSGGASGGMCKTTYDTTPAQFLAGKGLTIKDYGVTHGDAAYVLISHGPTGYGAYTTSGAQKMMPTGDELANTRATGPFVMQAWSDPSVTVNSANHFDDVLLYRSVADVAKNAGLVARDWPDVVADIVFNTANISAALGRSVTPGDLGTSTVNFGNTTVTGSAGGAARDLTLVNNAGRDALGIAGTYFNPLSLSFVGNYLTNAGNEYVNVGLPSLARKFAITLDNFGYNTVSGTRYTEQARLTFRRSGVAIATATEAGCRTDGGLASFAMDVGKAFDSVDVQPLATAEASWEPSFFLISEVAACDPATATCNTTLAGGSNNCTAGAISAIDASVITVAKSLSATSGSSPASGILVTLSYSNVGTLAASGVTLVDTLPAGMTYEAGSGQWSDTGSAALTDASDGAEAVAPAIDYSYDSASSTVTVVVSSIPKDASGFITFKVDVAPGLTAGTVLQNTGSFSTSTQASTPTNSASYTVTP